MLFKKGESYKYSQIDYSGRSYEIIDYGAFYCGCNFLTLEEDNKTYSFVLTGSMGDESIYECIYSE